MAREIRREKKDCLQHLFLNTDVGYRFWISVLKYDAALRLLEKFRFRWLLDSMAVIREGEGERQQRIHSTVVVCKLL